jgi:hypothetical protein
MRRLLLLTAAVAVLALPAAADAKTYYGTVGPTKVITLKNAAGTIVRRVPRGTHTFVIRDRSASHDFHLRGGGIHKLTGVAFVGRRTWSGLRIRAGVTYTYWCQPHASTMTRTFKGV